MKFVFLAALVAAAVVPPANAGKADDAAEQVLALERQSLDGWLTGNPDPMLETADPEITYYHVMLDNRLEGLPAVKELFERYRGTALYQTYEMVSPRVQLAGDTAVLTYRLATQRGGVTTYYNGTQVYQRKSKGWRVIHTHWSSANGQK